MSDIQVLAATLRKLAKPGIKRKDLIAAVRNEHPDATNKEIVRAAFYALTHDADADPEQTHHLHAFALTERAGDEEDVPLTERLGKKERRKERELGSQGHHR
ncbi:MULTISPECIES: hypothetical protein [Methylobacterium]|jgi:hypothetical protein|uniref:Uncharacterized protein n=2 Tax=Methylobacterium TaxID=407 RepID=A0A0C6FBT5_9HYPH|nr:hypothetical protein [Methylobacterium aquaticum]QRE77202.1 hypothetical protein F1D61_29955 [Methylobacterium aquaticum]BAQ45933.1 hypothetical protein Maq22A_c13600 [Methylobacterium aquaticum]